LKTQRWNKVASARRSIDDESNFGDSSYEVMAQHEDHAKIENGTKNDFHVLKQQLKREHEATQE